MRFAQTADQMIAEAREWLHTRPDFALQRLEVLLEVEPDHAEARRMAADAHWARAVRLAASGALIDAVREHRMAADMAPSVPEPWIGLGDALLRAGDAKGAADAYLQSVKVSVNEPQLARAALCLANGQFSDAEALLRGRLKLFPTDVAAIRMFGELAACLGRLEDAFNLLRRSLDLAPGFDRSRELLARLLARQHPHQALAEVDTLVEREPNNPSHKMLRASLLAKVGEQDAAREVYECLLKQNEHQPKIWMALGHVLKTLGEQDLAVNAYRAAIKLQPNLGEAWWSIANLKTFRFSDEDRVAMEAAIKSTTDQEDLWHLNFAMGKALENTGEARASFKYYSEGNRLRRANMDYSADDVEDQCRRLEQVITSSLVAERRRAGCQATDPIFIVGMPRAGSTLIEQILSSHSMVEGTMELPDMMMIAARLRTQAGNRYPEGLIHLTGAELTALGEEYIARARMYRKSSRPFFIDKMPNNWQHVGLIRLALPNAKIIDARRHPLACCLSAWTQHFAVGQAFSYDLRELGRYYNNYVYLMDAVDAASPGSVYRVIYERMVLDTEAEVRRLLGYLGLPFEDTCLSFWQTKRAVRTASSEQVRRPIFTGGLEHWKMYKPWLSPLMDVIGKLAEAYPSVPTRS